jgi:hypothetical protein
MPLCRLMPNVNNSCLQPMGSGRSRLMMRLLIILVSAPLMLGSGLTTTGVWSLLAARADM